MDVINYSEVIFMHVHIFIFKLRAKFQTTDIMYKTFAPKILGYYKKWQKFIEEI